MADFFDTVTDALRSLGDDRTRSDVTRAREVKELTDQLAARAKEPGFNPMTDPLLRELNVRSPQAAGSIADNFMKMDKRRRDAMYRDALRAKAFLETDQPDKAKALFESRSGDIKTLGGDPSQTDMVAMKLETEGPEAALEELDALIYTGRQLGHLPKELAEKSYQPQIIEKTLEDGTTVKQMAIPTYDPNTNEAVFEVLDMPEGFETVAETPEEKRIRELEKARKLESQKDRKSLVNRGTAAAESLANLYRAMDLLDKVETGGVDRWGLAARQVFGVEGADEGELSGNLGKAVLAQLRETFGAQFTQQEGDRLARIEAGFGRSPEANRRLLANAIGFAERLAKRGLKAAQELEDDFAIEDIKSLMEFRLDPVTIIDARAGNAGELTDEELAAEEARLQAEAAR